MQKVVLFHVFVLIGAQGGMVTNLISCETFPFSWTMFSYCVNVVHDIKFDGQQ